MRSGGRAPSPLAYVTSEAHPLIETLLPRELNGRVNLNIAADDETYHFALYLNHGHRGQALVSYVRGGLEVARLASRILDWAFGDAQHDLSVLDFASGFGRSTRFLVRTLPAIRLTVSDVQADAVRFQEQEFAVQGLRSHRLPSHFPATPGFDCIFAFSFFSHVPGARFGPWLAKLWSQLPSNGLLVFSTLGHSALPPSRALEGGLLFEATSDSSRLDLADYGTTWVSNEYVRRMIEQHCPGGRVNSHHERALWHVQDLYIVAKGKNKDLGPFAPRSEPEGYLERSLQIRNDTLTLDGWGADRSSQGPVQVDVAIDDRLVASCTADLLREDLASKGGDLPARSGWHCVYEAPEPIRGDSILKITARSKSGVEGMIHVSHVEGADSVPRIAAAATEASRIYSDLRNEVTAMRLSKFWRMRDQWFRLKEVLGLTRSS